MHRFVGSVLAMSILVAGCGIQSALPGVVDPACRTHADPADCQAALEAAMDGLGLDPDAYVVIVEPISCAGAECTTWVSAVPDAGDDCLPTYETEVARGVIGSWSVVTSAHGDPPCAFDP